MKSIITLFLLTLCLYGNSQTDRFSADIKETLYIHDTASSVTSELVALEAFKKLTEKYPDEWLPGYWTAYIYTQVCRLYGQPDYPKDLKPMELLKDSKSYLDKSAAIKGEMTDLERSDFLMLEAFIYSFSKIAHESEEERNRYTRLEEKTYKEAIKYNMRNPLMYVLHGIMLLRGDDYRDILAGIALLDYAEQIFDAAKNRGLTTHWNKDFINFWRSRAEEKLKKSLDG